MSCSGWAAWPARSTKPSTARSCPPPGSKASTSSPPASIASPMRAHSSPAKDSTWTRLRPWWTRSSSARLSAPANPPPHHRHRSRDRGTLWVGSCEELVRHRPPLVDHGTGSLAALVPIQLLRFQRFQRFHHALYQTLRRRLRHARRIDRRAWRLPVVFDIHQVRDHIVFELRGMPADLFHRPLDLLDARVQHFEASVYPGKNHLARRIVEPPAFAFQGLLAIRRQIALHGRNLHPQGTHRFVCRAMHFRHALLLDLETALQPRFQLLHLRPHGPRIHRRAATRRSPR